jgi:Trk K+ transport system NAD-binding subunit/mannitol/fructose-specific phosphotransferase system IIA component (Ntr-type)
VWLIDSNKEHCAFAASEGLHTLEGSALNEQELSDARASNARFFIALTPNTEVNALSAQLARTVFYVPNVYIVCKSSSEGHEALLAHLNGSTLFGNAVRLTEWDYRISHDRIGQELVRQTHVPMKNHLPARALYDRLQIAGKSLPLAIERGEAMLPFHADLQLEPGDLLHVLQRIDALPPKLDRFDALAARCPILDLEKSVSQHVFFKMAAGLLAPRLEMETEELYQSLCSHEKVRPSVLLPGMAIPHVIIPGTGKFDMLIGRCRDGILFDDDPGGVHMLFVLIGTEDERTFHLRSLSAIAQIMQREDFEKDWLQAADSDALRKLILHAVRRRMIKPAPLDLQTIVIPPESLD